MQIKTKQTVVINLLQTSITQLQADLKEYPVLYRDNRVMLAAIRGRSTILLAHFLKLIKLLNELILLDSSNDHTTEMLDNLINFTEVKSLLALNEDIAEMMMCAYMGHYTAVKACSVDEKQGSGSMFTWYINEYRFELHDYTATSSKYVFMILEETDQALAAWTIL